MLTTVDIPDDLCQQAESEAAREGVPLGDLIAKALRRTLAEKLHAGRQRITFPLIHSSRPGALGVEQVQVAEEAAAEQEDASRAGTL
jgi:hypothetical protein